MKYRVPVVYQMSGYVEVEANSREEAAEAALAYGVGLPKDASYIDHSFEVDKDYFFDDEYHNFFIVESEEPPANP